MDAILTWNAGLSEVDRQAKFCAMASGPFVFFRGTAHLFWSDLAGDARLGDYGGFTAWVSGDAHAQNFGAFDDDRGRIVYDVNDFDEATIADPQLDLWRLATSAVLIARDNGLDEEDLHEDVVDEVAESWLDAMAAAVGNDDELAYAVTEDDAYGRLDDFLDRIEDKRDRASMIREWTDEVGGVRRFDLDHDDLEAATPEEREALQRAFPDYLRTLSGGLEPDRDYFEILDIARRLNAGTGSLGAPRFYVLVAGEGATRDHRILDVKRQGAPAASASPAADPPPYADPAERVVRGHKALGVRVDDHLGWLVLDDGSYTVRERSPYKATLPSADLDTEGRLSKLAAQWGAILAHGHARSDDDHDPERVPLSVEAAVDAATDGDHAGFRRLVRGVALPYAETATTDHAAFAAWIADEGIGCP